MSNETTCPICDYLMEMSSNTVAGELIECRDCGSELEVTSTEPFTIEEAPLEEEDWGE